MIRKRPGFLVSLCLALIAPGLVFAQVEDDQGARDLIIRAPSAPPQLSRQVPNSSFNCQRKFVWQGKVLDCDSNLFLDGENLRPILATVPQSEQLLNDYQATRRSTRRMAFLSSVGLGMVLGGFLAKGAIQNPDRRSLVSNGLIFGGLAISSGTYIYGITLNRSNESRLGEAVQLYNQKNPSTPIQLQFTTGVRF